MGSGGEKMSRGDMSLDHPVKRGVDCWQRLVHTPREAGSGKFLITVHNGQMVKMARIDREFRISEIPHPRDTIPAP
jgi:hypothetical protein